jgi:hypothetical protein
MTSVPFIVFEGVKIYERISSKQENIFSFATNMYDTVQEESDDYFAHDFTIYGKQNLKNFAKSLLYSEE